MKKSQPTKTDVPELSVVMPVYQEEGAVEEVIRDWTRELDRLEIDYQLCVYNDGSRDATAEILDRLAKELPRVRVTHQKNAGHGPTVLRGYLEAEAEWIFQTDSDNEISADQFESLWLERVDYDFLIGRRRGTPPSIARKLVSQTAFRVVRALYGKGAHDVNSPFRLMRREAFTPIFKSIASDAFAPNVIITGLALKRGLHIHQVDVVRRDRQTGEVSLRSFKLLSSAFRAFWQTCRHAFK